MTSTNREKKEIVRTGASQAQIKVLPYKCDIPVQTFHSSEARELTELTHCKGIYKGYEWVKLSITTI